MSFKPLLASPADLDTLTWPRLASPKLDGIRAMVVNGKLLSRSLKEIPNTFINDVLQHPEFEGLDGELIVGDPTAKDVFQRSTSEVRRVEGTPDFAFYVFDWVTEPALSYTQRLARAIDQVGRAKHGGRVQVIAQHSVSSLGVLDAIEQSMTGAGYEGVMLRDPNAAYKFGRSTTKEGILLKVKRFEDSEAEIIGIEEEMHNTNAAQTNELGRTKRSTTKAGLVGKGTMGALRVRDLKEGWEFSIGTGFTAAQRAAAWKIGDIVKYKFFRPGMVDVPRHPVFLGMRAGFDL